MRESETAYTSSAKVPPSQKTIKAETYAFLGPSSHSRNSSDVPYRLPR